MGLLLNFMLSMSKWTSVLKFTFSCYLPISTHLSLKFHLVLPDEIVSFIIIIKMPLGFFDSCHLVLKEFIRTIILGLTFLCYFLTLRILVREILSFVFLVIVAGLCLAIFHSGWYVIKIFLFSWALSRIDSSASSRWHTQIFVTTEGFLFIVVRSE